MKSVLHNYQLLLDFESFVVSDLNLERNVGRGGIATVNKNKKKLLKLIGVMHQLYIKCCRSLKRQPNKDYTAVEIIDLTPETPALAPTQLLLPKKEEKSVVGDPAGNLPPQPQGQ